MRRLVVIVLICLIAGTATADSPETVWTPMVIAFQGKVRIRRAGWKQWAPVHFGIAVRLGDVLDTEAGASVQVLCADLSRGTLDAGQTTGVPCKSNQTAIKTDKGQYRTPLRGDSASRDRSLVLLSPRWTRIADAHPLIHWSAPADVKRLEIKVRGGNMIWTRTVEGDTTLRYPDDAPPLVPGNQYAILVTSGTMSSTRPGEPWPFFEVASRTELKELERQFQAVRRLGLGPEKTRVLEAKLLANLGMHAAAIERLQQVSPKFGAAVVDRLLGATYQHTGLDHLAVESYRAALRKAAANGDAEGEALAADALGVLCQRFGLCEKGEARVHLRKALAIYQKLGAKEDEARLNEELAAFQ